MNNLDSDRTGLPFPLEPSLPAEESARLYRRVHFRGPLEPSLRFELLLQDGWRLVEAGPALRAPAGLEPLARLVKTIGAETLHLSIALARLPREIASADWLELLWAAQRIEVVHRHLTPTPAGTVAALLGRLETLGEPWIVRATALKDGDRLFYVRGWCAASAYPGYAEELMVAVHGLTLEHPMQQPCAEQLLERVAAVGDGPELTGLRVRFPASWQARGSQLPVRKGDAGPAPVLVLEDVANGGAAEMRVGLVPRAPGIKRAAVLQMILTAWIGEGLLLAGPPLEQGPLHSVALEVDGRYWICPVARDVEQPLSPGTVESPTQAPDQPAVTLVIFGLPGAWIWAGLRTPGRDAPLEARYVARRAFDVVLEQMHRFDRGTMHAVLEAGDQASSLRAD